jgi:hypothetical protein
MRSALIEILDRVDEIKIWLCGRPVGAGRLSPNQTTALFDELHTIVRRLAAVATQLGIDAAPFIRMLCYRDDAAYLASEPFTLAASALRERASAAASPPIGDDKADDGERRHRPSVSARMLETMSKQPESHGWTAEQWRAHVGCRSASTVKESAAWKSLQRMKAQAKLDRAGG